MNKIFLSVILLVSSVVNMQASEQRCSYEWSCINPERITRVYSDGREEIIYLQPGEDSRKKIEELQEADKMHANAAAQVRSNKAKSAKAEKNKWTTLGCFSSTQEFVDSEKVQSSGIPTFAFDREKLRELAEGNLNEQTAGEMLALIHQHNERQQEAKK